MQQKKVKVEIEWQGNKVLHPPTGSQYITVSKFNANWEDDAWSIVLEFEVPPSKQGNPSYGFAKFLVPNAPQDQLVSGSKFELYEGANLVAIVSVIQFGGEEISAANRIQLEKLKTQYRQNASWMNPSEIKNQKLYNIIDDLYRPGAKYGSGSTADAARLEIANPGMKIRESDHVGKAQRYVRALEDIIQNGNLSAHEGMIAENIRLDLLDSLGKKLWYSQTYIPKPY